MASGDRTSAKTPRRPATVIAPPATGPGATDPGSKGPGVRKQYTVRQGDTLWGIAQQTLGSGERYRQIAGLNQGRVHDPGEIQPGWVLDMPPDAHGPGVQTVPASGGNGTGPGNGGNPVSGGDHVRVDLQRADAAASALEGLRDALAQHVPAILTAISNLRSEGATLPPPTALTQLQGRSPQDAAEMRAAARIATVMNNQLLAQQPPVVVTGKLDLGTSWDPKALDAAAAQADAQALVAAESSKDKGAARAAILGVSQDLADHQGDTSYLTAFWSRSGVPAAAANLANVLNRQDGSLNALSAADQKAIETRSGTLSAQGQRFLDNGGGAQLLSAQDQQILSAFGNSLAAATKAGQLDPAASQRLVDAFAKAPDLWSAGMLIKYGPDGAAYGTTADGTGPKLLSGLTEALLTAREHGGYTIPLQSRFAEVDPGNPSQMDGDPTRQLAQWGPLNPVMQRAAQNGVAATQVIDGYDPVTGKTSQQQGVTWAHQLMDPPKITYSAPMGTGANMGSGTFTIRDLSAYPDGIPGGQWGYISIPSSTSAAFLYAAAANTTSKESAQATLNILQANSQIDPSKTTLSSDIRKAFISIAKVHVFDFAMSSYGDYGPGITSLDGMQMAVPDQQQLDTFLRQALQDPSDFGRYQAYVNAEMSTAVGMTQLKNQPWVKYIGSLAGMVQRVKGENDFQGAEAEAARKAEAQELASLAIAPIMLIPTPAPAKFADLLAPTLFAWPLAKLGVLTGTNVWADNIVKSGDPAMALFGNDQAFVNDKLYAQITTVKGLMAANLISPEDSSTWFSNGHFDRTAFANWYTQHAYTQYGRETLDQWVQDARDGMQLQQ